MSEKCLVAMRLRAGTLTAEVPPEETEDVLAALARLYGKYWIAYVKDDTGRLWSWAYGEKRRGTASSWRVSPSIWRRGGEGGNIRAGCGPRHGGRWRSELQELRGLRGLGRNYYGNRCRFAFVGVMEPRGTPRDERRINQLRYFLDHR